MTKGLKIRAMFASAVLGACACAAGMMISTEPSSVQPAADTPAAVSASVGAAKKASSDDLARRYRRVVRRRSVVVI